MTPKTTEDTLEQTALIWLSELGFEVAFGPDLAFDGTAPERSESAAFSDVVLEGRLRDALLRINPDVPEEAIDDAMRKVLRPESPSLIENNRTFHRMLTDGIDVSWQGSDGTKHAKVWLLALENINDNDFLAVNQFTVIEDKHNRRPDVILFVNGLPLSVIELKNPADPNATNKNAYNQLQTYKDQIPSLFVYNETLVISDGMEARVGTLTSGWDRFMPWRTIDGEDLYREPGNERQSDGQVQPGLETLIKGMYDKERMLDYALNFVTFEDDGSGSSGIIKKASAYHQYHAVNQAVSSTLNACGIQSNAGLLYGRFIETEAGDPFKVRETTGDYGNETFGDKRIGVIWHTQGSGKSLSMAFYAGKIIRHPAMANPTILVITDRNDLDDQLSETFNLNQGLLRQSPVQAKDRVHLRELLSVASGGVVFTTIQKFMPDEQGEAHDELSDRKNIVVIADEAHRSQYDFIDGYARHMHDALPNASFIGFTGTPVDTSDKNTERVFGNYIDTYDILRAVEDGATVPIYYENRLARIQLNEDEKPTIDAEFEVITEDEEEDSRRQHMRNKWASLEAMVGTENRLGLIAEDLVSHFGSRQDEMRGKGLIVCMSRRICVDLYNAIIKVRPDWHHEDEDKGKIKIVMSGSASDILEWQPHIRTKKQRETMAKRFKDPSDELELVIVRDMWLTGFDCPSMHTMYIDKPMGGHNLMQAIARVNRVFKDKPGGLVVDFLGIADALKKALGDYTESGGKGEGTIDQDEAARVMQEKFEIVCDIMHDYDWEKILSQSSTERIQSIAMAMDYILGLEDGKKRFLGAVSALSKAFALAVPHDDAIAIRDHVRIFQEIRASLVKATGPAEKTSTEDMDTAIKQLVARSVESDEIIDIFDAAGVDKPDISILSDEFLMEVKKLPQKNLALEMLRKLINDEISVTMRRNVVQAKSFAEMLEQAITKYQNRAIDAAQVIEELIDMAKEMKEAQERGDELGLNDDELAFYDALGANTSAVDILGDTQLAVIAHELLESVKRSVSVDWSHRENARAQIRLTVKRILKKYGYPPDLQESATQLVLEQAEALCQEWT